MMNVKHLMDTVDNSDGQRLWVEPIGCTKDLCEWCHVNHVLSHLGPPRKLWDWFEEHPDCYDEFRARYHEYLARGPYRDALQQLACIGRKEAFTFLHQGEDPRHNTATALFEFLTELEAYCPRDNE
jgi:uncharacterized protein YeaO (DUF488 family)